MSNLKSVSRYRRKLFYNFFFIFIAFALVIGIFQFQREKQYKTLQLENELLIYVNLVQSKIVNDSISIKTSPQAVGGIIKLFPQSDLRITIIGNNGSVWFDSFVEKYQDLENHINRPEVQEALIKQYGNSIRTSSSTGQEYYYCAVNFQKYFIRAALPHDIQVENLLKVDTVFIFVILFIFIVFVAFLIYLSDMLGKSIISLQKFALKAAQGDESIAIEAKFPKNELGDIGNQIVQVYNKLQKTKKALSAEREKIFRHLQIAQEGIAVFTKDKTHILANANFVQFLNTISDKPSVIPDKFFKIKDFKPINNFIDNNLGLESNIKESLPTNQLKINKNGRYYIVQAIVFKDSSFEISISDVTKVEKEKKLKQEMTSNIAHELKTPVSSILGYLETILQTDVDKEKQRFFLERSYIQTQRLSALIQDISLLNKIEEASSLFTIEEINVSEVVRVVMDDLRHKIDENEVSIKINMSENLYIQGNRSVFYSIWRNLTENAVNYAGKGAIIKINNYLEDEKNLYFSFADNGQGIPEEHLTRIFERFYRVDSGRARSMGGTGLGLAIVKNGVQYHKGEISVKNVKKGGLEFIFSICKDIQRF